MAQIRFNCPGCGTRLVVDEMHIGKVGQCKQCGAKFPIKPRENPAKDKLLSRGRKLDAMEEQKQRLARGRVDALAAPASQSGYLGHAGPEQERSAVKRLEEAQRELAAIVQQDGRVAHPVAQEILRRELQTLMENLAAAVEALQKEADGKHGGLGSHEVGIGLGRLCDATLAGR